MTSHRFPVASQPTDHRCRDNEFFSLHPGLLLHWNGDLDGHAKTFADLMHRSQFSPPMTAAAIAGTAELLASDWAMNQGQSAEAAVARSRDWRRRVVNHIWGVIAVAKHTLEHSRGAGQVTNGVTDGSS